jgi:hypothetical protein
MGTTTKSQYDTDFAEWTAQTAELLRHGRFDAVDVENLAEEIEDLGGRQRSAVRSQLLGMLKHLIEQKLQPNRDESSWRTSIVSARTEIELRLEDSPSLRRHLRDKLQAMYDRAVKDAFEEANLTARAAECDIPKACPCTLDELLEGDLETLWPRG